MAYMLGTAALAFLLWMFLCAPSRKRRRALPWRGTAFAHRGLHCTDSPENSLTAFACACEAGYGSELDVQMTKDGHLVVFHDDDLERMTGKSGLVRDATLHEIRALRLAGSNEKVPTLQEVLDTVAARAPLLIEIKSAPQIQTVTQKAVHLLKSYNGRYLIESFDPFCLLWLRKNAPQIVRGYLVQSYADYREARNAPVSFIASSLLTNIFARPDFIAHSREMQGNPSLWLNKRIFRTPTAEWTILAHDEIEMLSRSGVMPIFEQNNKSCS